MPQSQSKKARRPQKTASPPRSSCFAALLVFPPALAQAPIPVDQTLFGILVAACLASGFGFGALYRTMRRNEESAARRLEQTEAQLRTLLAMTDEAVLVLDADGIVRNANPAAEEIFARPLSQSGGCRLCELLLQPMDLAGLTKNGPAQFHSQARLQGGAAGQVEVFLSSVHHPERVSYLAVIRRPDAASAAWREPVSRFCHDLNNQLTGVIGHLSLILMNGTPEPSLRERLLGAKKTALQAQEITRNLHQFTRGDDPRQDPGTAVILPMPTVKSAAPARGGRVLVLDDEEVICTLVSTALGSMGFEVTEATDVPTAMRACEDAVKSGRPFQLVLTDLSLPGDTDGLAAVAKLRAIDPALKAIISSGYENDPVMERYREHGFCAAIAKPYEISTLGRVIRAALGEAEHRRTA